MHLGFVFFIAAISINMICSEIMCHLETRPELGTFVGKTGKKISIRPALDAQIWAKLLIPPFLMLSFCGNIAAWYYAYF